MKNFITRRILIIMSIGLFTASLFMAFTGVFLSEGLISDIKAREFIPDLSVLANCTVQYINGSIPQEVYSDILDTASSKNGFKSYLIYGASKELIYQSGVSPFPDIVEKAIHQEIDRVLQGETFFYSLPNRFSSPYVLAAVPIIEDNNIIGGVFVVDDLAELILFRSRYLHSFVIAVIFILPCILLISYYVLKRLTRPLKNVLEVALAMVKGDFSVKADETVKGELGLLGTTINRVSIEFYRNVSALFLEKMRLQQVLSSLEEGIVAVDTNRKITHVNPAFYEIFNISEDTLNETGVYSIPALDDIRMELSQSIDENCTVVKNINHGNAVFRTIIAPIENEKHTVAGAVILFHDISEFEKLEHMRRDYVANVSHELRSPLTAIRGLIEPLRDAIVTETKDISRYHDIIYRETLRLSSLIDDIMELSRLQSNEIQIKKNPFDLNPLLEMVYERYRLYDESITLYYHPSPLPMVYSNPDRIEQIMVILLDNAFKFTPEGGEIHIKTSLTGDKVYISVADTGCSILKEDLPYVFDRFYKGDKSRTHKGTGLGLSIAREILNEMGETIRVKSEQGKGSEFTFTAGILKS